MQANDRSPRLKLAAVTMVAGLALAAAADAQELPATTRRISTTALGAPVLFTTTTGTTTIHLSWSAVSGAIWYDVFRQSAGAPFPASPQYTITAPATAFTDVVSANKAYYYFVRARNGTETSANSNVDLGTTVAFTNDPIVAQRDELRAVLVNELRAAIDYARTSAGLGNAAWTNADLANRIISVEYFQEMRDALNQALSAVGIPQPAYTDTSLVRGQTVIKKVHLKELRQRVKGVLPGGVLTVINPRVNEPFFSPNGDGSKDATTVLATMSSADSSWTVTVKSAASAATVRTATGFGAAVSYAWDGRDGAGNVQPDGNYTVVIDAVDGIYRATATTSAVVDLVLPSATINSPSAGATLSNVRQGGSTSVTVTGTATDANFLDWTVSYGLTSGSQTTFGTGTSAVSNAQLGTWNSAGGVNGAYTLKLVARDKAGNSRTATADVSVVHFSASQSAYSLNTAAGGTVTYTSIVPFTLTETLTIRNSAGATVRTLVNATRAAGTYNDVWNGRNDAGSVLSDGPYSYIVTVTEGTNTLTWDLSGQMRSGSATQYPYPSCSGRTMTLGPCDSHASAARQWDPFTNDPLKIHYSVAEASRVTVLFTTLLETTSLCSNPNTCVVNAEFRAPGDHVETWAGVLPSGFFATPKPYITVIRRTDTFPKNFVVLYGSGPPVRVSDLTLTPSAFGPESGTMSIAFDLAAFGNVAADVTLSMVRQPTSDTIMSILRTVSLPARMPGRITYVWDGKGGSGHWVAPGEYALLVTATADGRSSTATSRFIVVY